MPRPSEGMGTRPLARMHSPPPSLTGGSVGSAAALTPPGRAGQCRPPSLPPLPLPPRREWGETGSGRAKPSPDPSDGRGAAAIRWKPPLPGRAESREVAGSGEVQGNAPIPSCRFSTGTSPLSGGGGRRGNSAGGGSSPLPNPLAALRSSGGVSLCQAAAGVGQPLAQRRAGFSPEPRGAAEQPLPTGHLPLSRRLPRGGFRWEAAAQRQFGAPGAGQAFPRADSPPSRGGG